MKKMIVEFMVEHTEHFNSDMEYDIVERYLPCSYPFIGYDILRVETDDIKNIRVINKTSGIEYVPSETETYKNGNETVHYVKIWDPVTE